LCQPSVIESVTLTQNDLSRRNEARWPIEPELASVEAFIHAFATLGYEACDDHSLEAGFEKVAIYTGPAGIPRHMARQLKSGVWTSKCGGLEDIIHALEGLKGEAYGRVTQILRRPVVDT
jgi:hypothetical protein